MTERREVTSTSWEVGVVVGSYGLGFGALAVANGLSVLQAVVLSLLVFTGASQFALVSVIGAGGSPASGVLAALALGTRNTFYGLRLRSILQATGWRRAAAAQLTIDESTAVALAQRDPAMSRLGFWTTGLVVSQLLEPRDGGRRVRRRPDCRPESDRPGRRCRCRVSRVDLAPADDLAGETRGAPAP